MAPATVRVARRTWRTSGRRRAAARRAAAPQALGTGKRRRSRRRRHGGAAGQPLGGELPLSSRVAAAERRLGRAAQRARVGLAGAARRRQQRGGLLDAWLPAGELPQAVRVRISADGARRFDHGHAGARGHAFGGAGRRCALRFQHRADLGSPAVSRARAARTAQHAGHGRAARRRRGRGAQHAARSSACCSSRPRKELRFVDGALEPRIELDLANNKSVRIRVVFELGSRRFPLSSGAWFEGTPGWHLDTTEGVARPVSSNVTPAWLQRLYRSPALVQPMTDLPRLLVEYIPRVAASLSTELPDLSQVADVLDATPNFQLRATGDIVGARVQPEGRLRPVRVRRAAGAASRSRSRSSSRRAARRGRSWCAATSAPSSAAVQQLMNLGFQVAESGEELEAKGDAAISFWTARHRHAAGRVEALHPERPRRRHGARQVGRAARARVERRRLAQPRHDVRGRRRRRRRATSCASASSRAGALVRLQDGTYAPVKADEVARDPRAHGRDLRHQRQRQDAAARAGGARAGSAVAGRQDQTSRPRPSSCSRSSQTSTRSSRSPSRARSRPRCARTRRRASRGSCSCTTSARAASSPTTWASARPCRRSRCCSGSSKKKTEDHAPGRGADVGRAELGARDRAVRADARPRSWHGADRKKQTDELDDADVIDHQLRAAPPRRGVPLSKLNFSLRDPRRSAAHQEPDERHRARGEEAAERAPPGAHRHADREPPERDLVDLRLRLARLARRPRAVRGALRAPDRARRQGRGAEAARDDPSASSCAAPSRRSPRICRRRSSRTSSCRSADEQRKLYTAGPAPGAREVMGEVEQQGLAKSQIQILAALTRLRQVGLRSAPAELEGDWNDGARAASSARCASSCRRPSPAGTACSSSASSSRCCKLIRERARRRTASRYEYLDGVDQGPHRARRPLQQRRVGAGVPDLAQGGRHRPQPHRRRHRHPLRPVVEPGGRRPGDRPRAPHRPDARSSPSTASSRKDTIEEKILQLSEKKRELVANVLSSKPRSRA